LVKRLDDAAARAPIVGRQRLLWGLALLLTSLAGSFALWDPLEVDERVHLRRITQHFAQGTRADLESEVRSLLSSQALLARSWAEGGGLAHDEWAYEAGLFLQSHAGCLLVEWLDYRTGARWRLVRPGSGKLDADALASKLSLLEQAPVRARLAQIQGPVFGLPDGRPGVLTLAPVLGDALFVAVFDVETLLTGMLSDHEEVGYGLSVQERGRLLYRYPRAPADDLAGLADESALRLAGIDWRLRVCPTATLLREVRSSLPELAFVLGGLLGVLLAIAVGHARTAHRRSVELGRARDEVERMVAERTAELEQVNRTLRGEVQERTQAEQTLRSLSSRLLRVQDEERRHLARELHDSTLQTLAAVGVGIERARRLMHRSETTEAKVLLQESGDFVEQATREIRTLSFLLHPPVLDDLGLEYALPWYVNGFGRRSGIAVRMDVQRDLGRMPADVELALYRTVQEGLANVHHHSGSRTASITLFRDSGFVILELADSGCGFKSSLEAGAGKTQELGVGIVGMRERAHQLGGTVDIQSDGDGTKVRVALPLRSDESAGTAA
jgi:signal transduction histidine kinase